MERPFRLPCLRRVLGQLIDDMGFPASMFEVFQQRTKGGAVPVIERFSRGIDKYSD